MRHLSNILTLALLLVGTCVLQAQVTTATLSGKVNDEKGEALIAAAVIATHMPSGVQYGVTTRDDGSYTLPNLRVGGPYTIQATYLGYEQTPLEGIFLTLGRNPDVDLVMASSATLLNEITVKATADPLLNSERTGAATNIGSQELTRLPTISRSASDFTRLTPSASGNSFGGRNDQFNNFSLDGSIFNNPFGLDAATPGGQTDAQPVSLDAIEAIQVNLAPYDVTQAGFTGASVNAVTKSGTNALSGTVFGFYRNQDFTGSKVDGESIFVPELTQLQTGFSVGGPLIKNKLFFFINAELERREDAGSNFIAAAAGRSGEQVSRVEEQDLIAVSNVLSQRFGYETGPYENYVHNTDNQKGIIKLDWNINQNHTLTATYNFLDATKQKPAHPSAIGRRGPDATTLQFFSSGYQINNIIHSGVVELRSLFGNKYSNKLLVGYTSFTDSRDPLSAPFPVLNINRDGIRYIVAGHEPFSINNRLNQDVLQITDNFNIYLQKHTLTVGGSLERFAFDNSFNLGVYEPFGVDYPGGTFGPGFGSVTEFVDFVNSGAMDAVVTHAQNTFNSNTAGGNVMPPGFDGTDWALAETNVGQLAFYVQDDWEVSDRFKLSLGLRADIPLYFDTDQKIEESIMRNCCYDPSITYFDENGDPLTIDLTVLPDATPLLSPRLGFNYDINGDRTAQLRGGTGLFTGRLPFVWIGNHVANPNSFFFTPISTDFKFPQVWRTNLGYDQRFGDGWTATVDVIYTKDVNAMLVRNYGLKAPTGTLQGVDNRPIYTDGDRGANTAYVFTNTDIGRSINLSAQLQRNWANGWFTSLAYNFLDAKDASSIEAEITSDAYERNPAFGNVNQAMLAPSIYGNRHRVVGAAHKRFAYNNWGTTVAVFMEYAEGGRFSYTYSGDLNGDASGLNDLLYIPTDSELNQMNFDSDEQRRAFGSFISQDEYLSANRGSYVEKYGILSPWYSRWDLRLLQDFTLPNSNSIEFSIDILNVGNLISSKWGVRQFPTNTQPVGVSVANGVPTYSFDPNLENSFTNDFSLLSRWQMQLGLRYRF